MSKEILINQLFAGGYLEEGENIGHEVINLFKDDDGNNNLFITPSGHMKGHDVEYILFVRNVSARRTVEVVGLAKGLNRISEDGLKQVRYAGVSLDDIFRKNTYRGETDIFTDHVTVRAEQLLLPSKRILISIDECFSSDDYLVRLTSIRKVIIPQGMREYYSAQKDSLAYTQLLDLINNTELWTSGEAVEKLIPDGSIYNQAPSFLEIIRKEDDENIFSNLLSYYFQYSHVAFQRFASSVLHIPNMSASFNLFREKKVEKGKGRIDILLESENDIVVIENKIKSGINGVTTDDNSQLNSYYEYIENEAKNTGRKAHYYVFVPDYSRIDLSQFGMEEVYRIVKYSEIYRFFTQESPTYISDRAFPDFLRGLKRHTLTIPELQFETMRSRLLRKINQ